MAKNVGDDTYKKRYIEEVQVYLKKNKDRSIKLVKAINEEKGMTVYENRLKVKLPSIEGFAKHLGKARRTLYYWAERYPDFKDALDDIMYEQKERLINMGLSGDYNSAVTNLILSTNHRMVRRTDTTTEGKPLNTFTDEQVNRIAERVRRGAGNDGDVSS